MIATRATWTGLPASALTALPACPACYPAYAGVLSSLGLGALNSVGAQAIITVAFLIAALGALFYRARARRGLGPFVLGLVAAVTVIGTKFVLGWEPGSYGGVGVLMGACVWNAWPVREESECVDCAADQAPNA
ncbi:MAG: hypothetical protein V3T08_07705 [Gemmatimonadota bacterium]